MKRCKPLSLILVLILLFTMSPAVEALGGPEDPPKISSEITQVIGDDDDDFMAYTGFQTLLKGFYLYFCLGWWF
ncbi:MAG: hypothetical protein QF492_00405 [Candidatus Krumholzibacteria bacterium]|jgi:hypothetical protein|nr:hypothetical protein [Candidatus Krumholzibacteria bacterium]MDP6668352.1 hypothetical protein [Candidatus Krumholzibacteria bacterium]MDP6796288.1 hypothetical protein [Candidatus Krumholzibacteria bacterium]MDP7022193.1 hypothetical protein [Candidatus Krumholzibacteria bacterium]